MAKVQIKSENLTPLGGFFDDGTIKCQEYDFGHQLIEAYNNPKLSNRLHGL